MATLQDLQKLTGNPNVGASPAMAGGQVYRTPGGQYSTDPKVLGQGAYPVPFDDPSRQSLESPRDAVGVPKGMISVPGVGVVPEGTYGTAPYNVSTQQPSPTNVNANPFTQGTITPYTPQIPQIKNIETPLATPEAQKYQQTFNNLQTSGGEAPTSQGEAMVKVSQAQPPTVTEYKPTPQFTQYAEPIMQTFLQSYLNQQREIQNKGFALQSMKAVFKDRLNQMDTRAMNMKNIIEGTEDDIRKEIAKGGGFATESQVQALANARNKDLIRSYNAMVQEKQNLVSEMNMQVSLADADRQYAKDTFDNTVQAMNLYKSIENNAEEQLNRQVQNLGYGGLSALYQNDPYSLSLAEQRLGLPSGSLRNPTYASLLDQMKPSNKDPLDQRLKQLQIQKAERELRESTPTSNETFSSVVEGATALLAAPRQPSVRKLISNSLNEGEYQDAYAQIGNVVEESLSGEAQTRFGNARTDYLALEGLRNAVKKYADAGGNMGLITGKEEEIKRKLGIDSGKATELAVQLWRDFQSYRLNMTGAAFGAAESRDYASVNPTLGKSLDLNLSVIDGARNQLKNKIESTINTRIPKAKAIGELAEKGFYIDGLTITFSNGSSFKFPSKEKLEQFKKDKNL